MQEIFIKHINSRLNFLKGKKLLITISGGLDSVTLTHLCKEAKLDISLAHCNFNLRDEESNGDEAFVLNLAEKLDVELFTQHFDTTIYAQENKLSIQMAARELRYNWFQELSNQLGFDYILTAHHADDNLETFLINLTRGTGLEGLTGIPETNGNIVRPLLKFSRETILDFAEQHKIEWREDSSNASTKYLRNKLRHEIIPKLKETNSQLLQNFDATLMHLNDASSIVEESVNAVLKRAIIAVNNDEITYDISEFIKLKNPKAYLVEVFKPFGFTAFGDIQNLLTAQSGKQIFSETHRLIKDRSHIILAPLPSNEKTVSITILKEDKNKSIPKGILFFEEVNTIVKASRNEIFVDIEKLSYPLTVRKWKEGDYFYPLGGNGKKKLSKYFKDEKLSLLDKEKCLLLCSNNEIVCVLNYRADERFKVTKNTNKILKISLKE
ncbi:tRNA lysidine(34) synthetase TilS [uncultured Lacinutrix sp.]|uniref:tRNA lysidine(34) synthetase TilS n=1 Tax=uncultured Lacinutrix sp. TaxID=574032 RepID=UPI002627788D|nr:tRNA lysidine(34) synthetase TilS [uncultured Lacinutrix sp.]